MKETPADLVKNMNASVEETFDLFRGKAPNSAVVLRRLISHWRLLQTHMLKTGQLKGKGGTTAVEAPANFLTVAPVDVLIREVRELKWVTALTGSEDVTAARNVVSSAVELADMQEEGE